MIDPSEAEKFIQQTASSTGISGKVYIDVAPEEGFLRAKVVDLANFKPTDLVNLFCQALSLVSKSLNLEVKVYTRE